MNSIKHATLGLSSSLFLAAGLTRLAEKADPMLKGNQAALTTVRDNASTSFSEYPCSFTPRTGQ